MYSIPYTRPLIVYLDSLLFMLELFGFMNSRYFCQERRRAIQISASFFWIKDFIYKTFLKKSRCLDTALILALLHNFTLTSLLSYKGPIHLSLTCKSRVRPGSRKQRHTFIFQKFILLKWTFEFCLWNRTQNFLS